MRVVEPCKMFWTLSEGTKDQAGLHQADIELRLQAPQLCTALGMRDAASIADWADSTRDVFTWYRDDRMELLPSDLAAIKAALAGISAIHRSAGNTGPTAASSPVVTVFLLSSGNRICSSDVPVSADDQPGLK